MSIISLKLKYYSLKILKEFILLIAFSVSLTIISPTYWSIPNFSAISEGSLSNIFSIVKPLVCNISTIPFGISISSIL
jgi:hypothetical protein